MAAICARAGIAVAIGLAFGLAASAALLGFTRSLLYGVSLMNLGAYTIAVCAVLICAALGLARPIWRAIRTDVAVALHANKTTNQANTVVSRVPVTFAFVRHLTFVRSRYITVILLAVSMTLSACMSTESEAQHHHDANTAAGKLGQAAHKVAVQADKAGRVVGRQLGRAAHDAREGWKEDTRNSRQNK